MPGPVKVAEACVNHNVSVAKVFSASLSFFLGDLLEWAEQEPQEPIVLTVCFAQGKARPEGLDRQLCP